MHQFVSTLAVGLLGATGTIAAQGGPPMGGGRMGGGMMGDSAAAVVMPIVHTLMMNHDKLRRSVTNLPNGVRTITESDDSTMVAQLRAHVSTTGELVAQSKDLTVPPASPVLHALLRNGAQIVRTVELTPKGVLVTETSADPTVVSLLQAHAAEVSELVAKGMAALHKR
jgi:hypothetical protein